MRFHVSANEHTSLDVLMILSRDPMPIVRSGVAISLNHDPLASPTVQSLVERIGQSLASDPAQQEPDHIRPKWHVIFGSDIECYMDAERWSK